MSLKSITVLLASFGIGLLAQPAAAEPIYVQVDGTITTVSSGIANTFDQSAGYSFVFGWDPARASVAGPFQGGVVYSVPFSVVGTIGGERVDFTTEDFTEIPAGGLQLYFERDSTPIAGSERYGPNNDWGVRAFTFILRGWESPLDGIPDYISPGLFGPVELFIAEVIEVNGVQRAGNQVGAVRGNATSVQPVPEPASALMLLVGICGAACRSVNARTRRKPASDAALAV